MKISTNLFRVTAISEGFSYLALGITMPLKYYLDLPQPNFYVGMIHGILFMAYVGLALVYSWQVKWSIKITLIVLLASLIPFGTFYIDRKYLRATA